MPAKSKAQLKKMFILERQGKVPKGTALTWAHHTPNIKALPEHVADKKKVRKKRRKKSSFPMSIEDFGSFLVGG